MVLAPPDAGVRRQVGGCYENSVHGRIVNDCRSRSRRRGYSRPSALEAAASRFWGITLSGMTRLVPNNLSACAKLRSVAVALLRRGSGRLLCVEVGLNGHAKWAGQILQHRSRIWLYRASSLQLPGKPRAKRAPHDQLFVL